MLKIRGTEVQQKISGMLMKAMGNYAAPCVPEAMEYGWNGVPVGPEYAAGLAPAYFNMRKASIYGGTNEIQRNLIARMVLGREPAPAGSFQPVCRPAPGCPDQRAPDGAKAVNRSSITSNVPAGPAAPGRRGRRVLPRSARPRSRNAGNASFPSVRFALPTRIRARHASPCIGAGP